MPFIRQLKRLLFCDSETKPHLKELTGLIDLSNNQASAFHVCVKLCNLYFEKLLNISLQKRIP